MTAHPFCVNVANTITKMLSPYLDDGFVLIAWSCACALMLVAPLRKSPLNYGDLSAMQQTLLAEKEAKS